MALGAFLFFGSLVFYFLTGFINMVTGRAVLDFSRFIVLIVHKYRGRPAMLRKRRVTDRFLSA